MGQYLTTNLNIFFQYSKKEADQIISESNSGLDIITQPFIGDVRFFDFIGNNEWYAWGLKPDLLKDNLHDLLKRFYMDVYSEDSYYSDDCKEILASINTTEDLIKYAQDNSYTPFGYEKSWEHYYTKSSRHDYHIERFRLSCEGKIVTEGICEHLNFFSKLLRYKYADNPLSSCFSVNIWS